MRAQAPTRPRGLPWRPQQQKVQTQSRREGAGRPWRPQAQEQAAPRMVTTQRAAARARGPGSTAAPPPTAHRCFARAAPGRGQGRAWARDATRPLPRESRQSQTAVTAPLPTALVEWNHSTTQEHTVNSKEHAEGAGEAGEAGAGRAAAQMPLPSVGHSRSDCNAARPPPARRRRQPHSDATIHDVTVPSAAGGGGPRRSGRRSERCDIDSEVTLAAERALGKPVRPLLGPVGLRSMRQTRMEGGGGRRKGVRRRR